MALLTWSAFPLISIVSVACLVIGSVASKEENQKEKPYRPLLFIQNNALLALGALTLVGIFFVDRSEWGGAAFALKTAQVVIYLLLVGAAFVGTLIVIRVGQFVGDISDVWALFAIGMFGIYLVPSALGEIQGKMDIDPAQSTLPVIKASSAEAPLRLLIKSGDVYFAVRLPATRSEEPVIVPLEGSTVTAIRGVKPPRVVPVSVPLAPTAASLSQTLPAASDPTPSSPSPTAATTPLRPRSPLAR